ncbi:PAS domain S-box protein [Cetobacterium sp.]|uniref:PAS domain S-box protein n=1 Tax=Cetobacterium sp. TaxID=2071632 RepID=UPI003F3E9490
MKDISLIMKKVIQNTDDKEKMLEKTLDSLEEMISYTDIDGKFYYLNNSFAKFLGDRKENIIGKREMDFLSKEAGELCKENNRLAYKVGFIKRVDYVQGKYYDVFKSKVEIEGKKGEEISILSLIKEKK